MQRLPLKLLEPGMVVAKPVVNEKGAVLVSENSELNDKIILRLENMGIARVAVKGFPVRLPGYAPKSLQEIIQSMELGFSRIDPANDLMRKFRVLLKAYFIQRDREMQGWDSENPQEIPQPSGPSIQKSQQKEMGSEPQG